VLLLKPLPRPLPTLLLLLVLVLLVLVPKLRRRPPASPVPRADRPL
jgi:hypothetical protein